MSEINTNYTRALPGVHFPDNNAKVNKQKEIYLSIENNNKILFISGFGGMIGMAVSFLIALPVSFATNNMLSVIIIPSIIVLSFGTTAVTCLILKPRFKKIVEENEQKKLKLSDIRQIYSRETNQTRPFAEVAADVCFLY